MKPPKTLYLLFKSILLSLLLLVKLKVQGLRLRLKKPKKLKENYPMEKKKKPEKKTKKSLPSFPEELKRSENLEEPTKETSSGLGNGNDQDKIDIEEICGDIVALPFEVWAVLKPAVKPLSEVEKKLIAKPLSRIVVKYDVTRFMKDEILLCAFLGFSVLKRVKVGKNVVDDSGKEGQGKDDISEKPDTPAA